MCICFVCGGAAVGKNRHLSFITNIWRNRHELAVPNKFQIYSFIMVFTVAGYLSIVMPIYLLAFKTGCHTGIVMPVGSVVFHCLSVSQEVCVCV